MMKTTPRPGTHRRQLSTRTQITCGVCVLSRSARWARLQAWKIITDLYPVGFSAILYRSRSTSWLHRSFCFLSWPIQLLANSHWPSHKLLQKEVNNRSEDTWTSFPNGYSCSQLAAEVCVCFRFFSMVKKVLFHAAILREKCKKSETLGAAILACHMMLVVWQSWHDWKSGKSIWWPGGKWNFRKIAVSGLGRPKCLSIFTVMSYCCWEDSRMIRLCVQNGSQNSRRKLLTTSLIWG